MVSFTLKFRILQLYCTASAFLWLALLIRWGILLPLVGQKFLPGGIADYFIELQMFSLCADLLTYTIGKVSFNIQTFLINSIDKTFIMYPVIFQHPKVARTEYFSTLIVSWGLAELIKYIYLGYRLKYMNKYKVPGWLTFIQMNNFFILFPVRCISELALSFLSLKYIQDPRQKLVVKGYLLIYLVVAYAMVKKMLTRRAVKKAQGAQHLKRE